MCYVLCVNPNGPIRIPLAYALNINWTEPFGQHRKNAAQIERLPNTLDFFSPVTKPLFLATVYNDTAHLMGSLWVLVYLAKRFVDFLLLFLQHFSLAMGLFCPKFIKLLDCSQQSRKKK